MNKPKILHIGKYYYPFRGGIERAMKDICDYLKDEFEFTVLVSNEEKIETIEYINDTKVIRIPRLAKYSNMPVSISFIKWLKKLDYDLIHVNMPTPIAELFCLLHKTNKKILATYHCKMYKTGTSLYLPFQKMFLKKTDKIIVATKGLYSNSEILHNFKDKIEFIPLSVESSKFSYRENIENPYPDSDKTFKILFVGRLTEYKGLGYLIESMKYTGDDSQLHIVGTGKLENELKELVNTLRLDDRVKFYKGIDDDSLVGFYQYCDVFVLPSVNVGEAFGIVQLEAMAAGKPVINTYLKSGVPEVSINNETGFTVEPKDSEALAGAINKLKSDKKLCEKFGQNGINRVKKYFDKNVIMGKYRDLYYSLLDK